MTALRAEILSTLEQVPDNQLDNVLDFIKKILVKNDDELKKSQVAYERLRKNFADLKIPENATYDEMLEIFNLKENPEKKYFDYRDEVARAVLKKYASIG